MLLKCRQTEKKMKMAGNTQKRSTGNIMRLTNATQTAPRVQRKVVRNVTLKRTQRGVKEEPTVDPICDNSNDSGLGFDQHQEYNVALRIIDWPSERLGLPIRDQGWANESPEVKRKRLEIKIESDDANDNFSFPDSVRQRTENLLSSPPYSAAKHMSAPRPIKRRTQTSVTTSQLLSIHKDSKPPRGRVPGPNLLTGQLLGLNGKVRNKSVPGLFANQMAAVSRDGTAQLVIVSQPEQQHRARYQTEGSRGAVKDRTGNGFPQVQLSGWLGSATLEVFIGSDCGKVVPHMFYQACRVSGKNSTQCQERTEEGTVIIEVPFEPTKDMMVTCDCVGILKERNVDVEHRFPEESGSRNKKKSTRCRMVFRTLLTHPDGSQETLQICSQPIACTQPPGVPEICKKSLTSSPAGGGSELFILGKNFLKDTRVLFTNPDLQPPWEASVIPDKEYLQQSHLVCVVPPYHSQNMSEPVTVRLTVTSSDKSSEAHCFTYTPQRPVDTAEEENLSIQAVHPKVNPPAPESAGAIHHPQTTASLLGPAIGSVAHKSSAMNSVEPMLPPPSAQYLLVEPKQCGDRESIFPLVMWKSSGSDGAKLMSVSSKAKDMKLLSLPAARKNLQLMDPPALVPLPSRRLSTSEIKTEAEERQSSAECGSFPTELKGIDLRVTATAREVARLVAPSLKASMATGADLSSTLPPSMATLRRFVANDNGSPLPSLSVENFLSRLERKPENAKNDLKAGLVSQPDQKLVNGNITILQPEYISLDSVISLNMPAGSRPQTVSDYRRLSEEEIASACLESSRGVRRKPGKVKPVNTSHYCSPATPTNVQQNGKINAITAVNQLLSVVPEQMTFPLQPPASTDIHRRDSLDDRFLTQDLKTSSTRSVSDVSVATCQQSPQNACNDVTIHLQMNTYCAGSMESTVGCLPVGNVDAIHPSPEFVALPHYEEETSSMDSLQSQSNDGSTSRHKTSPFNSYRDESMHSPLIECKPLQEPPFENHGIAHVDSLPTNPMPTRDFIPVAGAAVSVCSQPIASKNVIVPSQVLPELNSNHRLSNFHCAPLPSIAENTRLINEQALSSVGNGYVVSKAVSSKSCTPPVGMKNILMHSQETSLFNNYRTENVSPISVGQSQMSQENNIVIEGHHPSTLNGATTKCQTLGNSNVGSIHVSSNNTLLDSNVSKTHIDFDVKNQIVTTSNSPLFASKNMTICSQDMYNFPPENGTTNLTHSPPSNCIPSHNSLQLQNHEISSPTAKMGLVNSLSLTAGNNYNITHAAQNNAAISHLPKLYAAHVSVDSTALETGLRQDLQDPVLVTSSLCSLPSTVTNGLLTTLDAVSCDLPLSGCAPATMRDEHHIENVPTSTLSLSNLLLHPAVSLSSVGSLPNHCPSDAMKNLILNCDMLSSEKRVSNTCIPLDCSLSINATSPVINTFNKVCSERASQIAMKDMMLRVDVSSTMDDQMLSQPSAVTPETVRLDALVNSTLDTHIHSTLATAMTDPRVEVPSPSNGSASATTLPGNMFPQNDHSKAPQPGNLQLSPAQGHGARDITQGLLCQATNTLECTRSNTSTENAIHLNNEKFKSEPITTTEGFAVMSTNTQFAITSDLRFTSAPASLQFTCVSTDSRNLGQLMEMGDDHVKTESSCTQKVELKDGLAVRERREEGMLPHELTQMSDHDLISYINPSCFDQV